MKRNMESLNNTLFGQLECLSDKELLGDALTTEMERANAMCNVSKQIIDNAALALKAHTTINTGGAATAPKMLRSSEDSA